MNIVSTALLLLLTAVSGVMADSRSVTFFSDGALIEIETAATKGAIKIDLSAAMLENSLRVSPIGGTVVQQVELRRSGTAPQSSRTLEQLQEQKERLEDRLRALATREEVFKSAAKSQSGKAPRKTKTNPDPMLSIRQGTDFAIAQLEAVYTARRKAEQELRKINARIAAAGPPASAGEHCAHIAVSPKNGRVRVRYALTNLSWAPGYDLRFSGNGVAKATLLARLPEGFAGYTRKAVAERLNAEKPTQPIIIPAGSTARLAEYTLTVSGEESGGGATGSFSAMLTNTAASYLPSGPASLYRNGEYWGRLPFGGISSGRSRRISIGG